MSKVISENASQHAASTDNISNAENKRVLSARPDQITSMPEILNIPPKLLPMITSFNQYDYFLIEGGRGSAKTQSIARLLLFIGEKRKVRVVCGREQQNTIEESVYQVLVDIITEQELNYEYNKKKIWHRASGSVFSFKGFREQGKVNIKGLEGVDILWIDEAQSTTKNTLEIIIPTIRKAKSKMIFSMNRYLRDDAVYTEFSSRKDCLHIHIDYFENPFCPLKLKMEAEMLKNRSEREYSHIWLGQPLAQADDYLFNSDKIAASYKIKPFGELFKKQRVLGVDIAAQGNDLCVATLIERLSPQHWKTGDRVSWDEPDTMKSVGKIVSLIGTYKPSVTVIDIGGMGKPVFDRLREVIPDTKDHRLVAYDGGSTKGVDTNQYRNIRASSYFTLKQWFEDGFLILDETKDREIVNQLEKIRFAYLSNGVKYIQAKVDMKKNLGYSPDDADSLNMAVWGACTALGQPSNMTLGETGSQQIKRVSTSRRTRQ